MEQHVRARKQVALFGAIATIVSSSRSRCSRSRRRRSTASLTASAVVYLVGVVEILGATIAAMAYNRWANRAEER